MKTWTFGRKLAAGFTAIVILTMLMVALTFGAMRNVISEKDHVISVTAQNLVDAERMRGSAWEEVALARGSLLTSTDHGQAIAEANARFTKAMADVTRRGLQPDETKLLSGIEKAKSAHRDAVARVLAERDSGVPIDTVVAEFERSVAPHVATLDRRIDAFVKAQARVLRQRAEGASRAADTGILKIAGIGLLVVLLVVALGLFLTRSLTRQIGGAVELVRSSSAELKTTAAQQASGAKEQSTAMNQVTTTVGELLSSSRQIAESAQRVSRLARETEASARTGGNTVREAREAVSGIQQQVDIIVQHMLDLGDHSQKAGNILEIINELAEQTNILAINATIEAAGAGEAGHRFAVVGDEIRKLADRVGGSTREIRDIVERIRSAVNATVMATETGSKTVEAGSGRFNVLAEAFDQIGGLVGTTTEAAREIELSTQQQTTAVEQVNLAVTNVAQATREAETGASQTAQTAAQMLSMSDELSRLVQTSPHT